MNGIWGKYGIPFGLNFQKDSVDFFRQFSKYERDTITHKMNLNAFAGFIPYHTKADSLFIVHPLKNNLEFKYMIETSLKDTLLLKRNDTLIHILERLQKQEKDTTVFDQIVLSRSGCFGSCPIMNISIKKNGNVLFYGEQYTDVIGFYKAQLSEQFTTYLFQKFKDINISKIDNYFSIGHTDDETFTTTFVQHGKIVKTIQDYGKVGTKELLWGYQTIENLYKQLTLSPVRIQAKSSIFEEYTFKKEKQQLRLKKSESFLLWNAFQNATITTTEFKKMFSIKSVKRVSNNKYVSIQIETDGQYYTFNSKNETPITYDIGYNFIGKNFTESDFKNIK